MTDGPGRVSTDTVDGAVGVDGHGGRGGMDFPIRGWRGARADPVGEKRGECIKMHLSDESGFILGKTTWFL